MQHKHFLLMAVGTTEFCSKIKISNLETYCHINGQSKSSCSLLLYVSTVSGHLHVLQTNLCSVIFEVKNTSVCTTTAPYVFVA
jgi:hypothetical protein